MATRTAGGINWELVLMAGAAVGAIYLLRKSFRVGKGAIDAISSGIATAYLDLTMAPNIQAAGVLDDQSGNVLGPIASFPAATDRQGNTYLAVNGFWFQMGPRDAAGNFTAIPTGQATG